VLNVGGFPPYPRALSNAYGLAMDEERSFEGPRATRIDMTPGWEEFIEARERFLARLRAQSELAALEAAWRAPVTSPPGGPPA
jgi:hypothetical protein